MKKIGSYRNHLFFIILLFFTGLIIYLPGLNGNFFVLDDLFTISRLQLISNWNDFFLSLQGNQTGLLKRPVSVFGLSLIKTIAGDNATYFKAVNWSIHSLNAVLVYVFLNQLAKIFTFKHPNTYILSVVCIWYCHPLLVSTVLYPVQLMTILSTFFMLLAINFYLHLRLSQVQFNLYHIVILYSLIAFALFSKEIGALLPMHFLLIEKFLLNNYKQDKQQAITKWSLIYIPIGAGMLLFIAIIPKLMAGYDGRNFTMVERLGLQSLVLTHYIKQILFPQISQLSLFQDIWHIDMLKPIKVIFSITLLTSLISFAWCYRSKLPLLGYGIFFFFLSHLLESTIIPLEISFEHRNYIASLGIILSLLIALNFLKVGHITLNALILSYSVFMLWQTSLRVLNWQTEFEFYAQSYNKEMGSKRAANGYSQLLFRSGERARGIQILTELKKDTGNGSYDIKLAILTCTNNPRFSERYLNRNNIESSNFNQYLSQVLFELFESIYTEKCLLSFPLIVDYHRSLLHHPQIKKQLNNKQVINLLLGRYYWLNEEKELSIQYYREALAMGNISAGLELLGIYQINGDDKNNVETLTFLESLKSKMEYKDVKLFEELKATLSK